MRAALEKLSRLSYMTSNLLESPASTAAVLTAAANVLLLCVLLLLPLLLLCVLSADLLLLLLLLLLSAACPVRTDTREAAAAAAAEEEEEEWPWRGSTPPTSSKSDNCLGVESTAPAVLAGCRIATPIPPGARRSWL